MPKQELTRKQRQEQAQALERRLDEIKARLPKKLFVCYVCGLEAETYAASPTVPPAPESITRLEDVKVIVTCGRSYCQMMEIKRQDALVQMVLTPQREAYYTRRREEAEAEKNRGKKS